MWLKGQLRALIQVFTPVLCYRLWITPIFPTVAHSVDDDDDDDSSVNCLHFHLWRRGVIVDLHSYTSASSSCSRFLRSREAWKYLCDHPLYLSRRHFGAADVLGAFLLFKERSRLFIWPVLKVSFSFSFSLARFLDGIVLCISSAHVVMEGAVSWWLTVCVNGCNS